MKTKGLITTLAIIIAGATMALAGEKNPQGNARIDMTAAYNHLIVVQAPASDFFFDIAPDLTLATEADLNRAGDKDSIEDSLAGEQPRPTYAGDLGGVLSSYYKP
jgi:hypothetical protein